MSSFPKNFHHLLGEMCLHTFHFFTSFILKRDVFLCDLWILHISRIWWQQTIPSLKWFVAIGGWPQQPSVGPDVASYVRGGSNSLMPFEASYLHSTLLPGGNGWLPSLCSLVFWPQYVSPLLQGPFFLEGCLITPLSSFTWPSHFLGCTCLLLFLTAKATVVVAFSGRYLPVSGGGVCTFGAGGGEKSK